IHINDAPRTRPTAEHDVHALHLRLLQKLKPIRSLKLPRPARRHAPHMRIVLLSVLLPNLIQRLRPRLKRHLIDRQIPRATADDRSAAAPESMPVLSRPEHNTPIFVPRSRTGRRGFSLAFAFPFAGPRTRRVLRRRSHRDKQASRANRRAQYPKTPA